MHVTGTDTGLEMLLDGLVLRLSRGMGLLPYDWTGQLSQGLALRSLALFCLASGLTGYTVLSGNLTMSGPDSQVVEMQVATSFIQFPLQGLAALTASLLAILRQGTLIEAFRLLGQVQPPPHLCNPSSFIRSRDSHSALSLLAFLFINIWDFTRWYWFPQRVLTLLSYYVPFFILLVIRSQFTYSVQIVNDKYDVVTKALSSLSTPRELERTLVKVRRIDIACMNINHTYTVSILIILAAYFCTMVSELYYLMTSFISSIRRSDYFDIFSLFSFTNVIIFIICDVHKMTSICSSTKKKIYCFNKKLYEVCITERIHNFSGNLVVKLHLQKGNDVFISAFNFFDIELSIMQSMLGAAATYLVIMLQFQLPSA